MKIGQGPLVPLEEKAIRDVIVGLIAEHGPDAVRWVWDKLKGEQPALREPIKEAATEAAQAAAAKKGAGAGLLLVGAALVLGGKKKRGRR